MSDDNNSQNKITLAPLMEHFRDELVANDESSYDYLHQLTIPKDPNKVEEEKKHRLGKVLVEPPKTRTLATVGERLQELQCLFLRRTIPTVAEKWRKRRISSSNTPESVFITQCCWVPSTVAALDTSSKEGSKVGTGAASTSASHRRAISSSSSSAFAMALSEAKPPGGGMGTTYLSHLLCGLSDGTLCLLNVLNFTKSYLIEGYGMRDPPSTRDHKEGHHHLHHSHHTNLSQDSRYPEAAQEEEARMGSMGGPIVALDCAPLPSCGRFLCPRTARTPEPARAGKTATAKRLSALERLASSNTSSSLPPSSTTGAEGRAGGMLCVVREQDGVYVRPIDDVFHRASHSQIFPGMMKEHSTSGKLSSTTTWSGSSSSSTAKTSTSGSGISPSSTFLPVPHGGRGDPNSPLTPLLTLPPFDPRIVYTTPTSTIVMLDATGIEPVGEFSSHSSTPGLGISLPLCSSNNSSGGVGGFRRVSSGYPKPLDRERRQASVPSLASSVLGRKAYTVASFSDSREYLLVGVPPTPTPADHSALRYVRERYAIAILQYHPTTTVPSGSMTASSGGGSSSSHMPLRKDSSSNTTTSSGGEVGYEVAVPWCPLPFPSEARSQRRRRKRDTSTPAVPAGTAEAASMTPSSLTRRMDSRASYPTPVWIQWWDTPPPSPSPFTGSEPLRAGGDGEEKHVSLPSSPSSSSVSGSCAGHPHTPAMGTSALPCPRILVMWSSGDIQLLQPWKMVRRAADLLPMHVMEKMPHRDVVPRRKPFSTTTTTTVTPSTLVAGAGATTGEVLYFSLKVVAESRWGWWRRRVVRAMKEEESIPHVEDHREEADIAVHPAETVITAARAWRPTASVVGTPPVSSSSLPDGSVGSDGSGRGVLAVVCGENMVEVMTLELRSRTHLLPSSLETASSTPAGGTSMTSPPNTKRARVEAATELEEEPEVAELVTMPLGRSYCTQDIPVSDIQLVDCGRPSLTGMAPTSASGSLASVPRLGSYGTPRPSLSSFSSSSSVPPSSSPVDSSLLLLTVVLRSGVFVVLELPQMREITRSIVGHFVDRTRLRQVMQTTSARRKESGNAVDYRIHNSINNSTNNSNNSSHHPSYGSAAHHAMGGRMESGRGNTEEDGGVAGVAEEEGEERFLWEWPPQMRAVIAAGSSGTVEKPALNICLVDHDTIGVPELFF